VNGFADYRPDESRRAAGSAISVRGAHSDDLEVCARMIVSRAGGSVEVRKERLLADLDNPGHYVAVACAGDEVIGYGGVIHHQVSPGDPSDTAPTGHYLIGLIIAPDWRRHGVGELLTVDRMRWTATRADHIYYFAYVANSPTLDLHERLGFQEVTRDFTFPNAPMKPGCGVLLRAPLPFDESADPASA
jgi:ribosomal protein S18 acetylase RimI-like enzyme